MSEKIVGGYFSLLDEGTYGVSAFSAFIVSWSLGNMKNSLTDAEQCGLVTVLMDKQLPSKPFSACLISYHASLYIAMLIKFSRFPKARFEELKKAIIVELYKIKDARGKAIYSEKEGELIASLILQYTEIMTENLSHEGEVLTSSPGESVMETVKGLYGLDDANLALEARVRFPFSLNASVASVYRVLIKDAQCQWNGVH
eukprot:GHVR01075211.1.p1 GENE.GHVR01075211.1~~GHVR01075211.1.p1  ORF type:complete len:200 (-),score=-0.17 GHVR01075211.1:143-742(-)